MPRVTSLSTADAGLAAIDRLARRELADTGLPGMAIGLTGPDGPAVVRTYGLADLAARRPIESDTLFEIGSIGKTFTAIVVVQLAEEGRLDLGAPVADALPWFEMPVVGRPITIHDLLTHTAGITAGIDGTPEAAFQVRALRDRRPGSAPGERFHYSNLGYKALGLVIEAVEGRPYPDVIRTRILDPLGMTATEPAITHAIRSRLAVGYDYLHDDRIGYPGRPLAPATWLETATADGCIASTAGDMAALARMLLRRGEGPGGRLVSEASFARMAEPHARPTLDAGYGYGLATRVLGGRTYLGHSGGMVGYLAALQLDPAAELAVMVLQNGMMGSPMALARAALVALRGPGADVATASDGADVATASDADDDQAEHAAGPDRTSVYRTDPGEGAGDPGEGAGDPGEGAGDPGEGAGDPARAPTRTKAPTRSRAPPTRARSSSHPATPGPWSCAGVAARSPSRRSATAATSPRTPTSTGMPSASSPTRAGRQSSGMARPGMSGSARRRLPCPLRDRLSPPSPATTGRTTPGRRTSASSSAATSRGSPSRAHRTGSRTSSDSSPARMARSGSATTRAVPRTSASTRSSTAARCEPGCPASRTTGSDDGWDGGRTDRRHPTASRFRAGRSPAPIGPGGYGTVAPTDVPIPSSPSLRAIEAGVRGR